MFIVERGLDPIVTDVARRAASQFEAANPIGGAFRAVALGVGCIRFKFEGTAFADVLSVAADGEPHLAAHEEGLGSKRVRVAVNDRSGRIFLLENLIKSL